MNKEEAQEYLNNLTDEKIVFSKVQHIIKYDIIKKLYIDKCEDIIDYEILKDLQNLEELHILHNNNNILYHIPKCIKILNISDLDIDNVNFLHYLENLINLNISNNEFCNIMEILLPKTIEVLDCSICSIENYEFIERLKNLKKLNISHNSINNLSDYLSETIEELIMECININNYEFLEKFTNLKRLNISYNNSYIASLDGIPKTIEYLDIYNSNIENIIYKIQQFSNLEKWNCSVNINYPEKLSIINLNIFKNLKFLDLTDIIIDSNIYLKNTSLQKLIIDFNMNNNDIEIQLPLSLEFIHIKNNKNINNYYYISDLQLKKIILDECVVEYLFTQKNYSVETILFISTKYSLSSYNFKCLNNLKNLKKLILDTHNEYNINKINMPDTINHIIISDICLLKNINYIKKLKNLYKFEINNMHVEDEINYEFNNIIIDLSSTNIKHIKINYNINNKNIINRILYMFPFSIEIIEYLDCDNYPLFLQISHENLKKIIIDSNYLFREYIIDYYQCKKIIIQQICARNNIEDDDIETVDI
ncbi:leucine rich repeat gene family protein [Betaentomopoxvirus amoorei]|uniref:AMV134 n=1 Tax=Amsacta moorei entomopoxvirus TaxID=28321 RepID=Q9EMR5_AMEPV|nr:leucine rich repeat gene family protein [Amsacta moorei entomopoxvirus]AAG02840.1 AMV134 [Amsacta moorei entomopoxvirus]